MQENHTFQKSFFFFLSLSNKRATLHRPPYSDTSCVHVAPLLDQLKVRPRSRMNGTEPVQRRKG